MEYIAISTATLLTTEHWRLGLQAPLVSEKIVLKYCWQFPLLTNSAILAVLFFYYCFYCVCPQCCAVSFMYVSVLSLNGETTIKLV